MGVPRLKKKAELNYRRGLTWKNCSDCEHFVADFEVRSCARDGRVLRREGRCKIIGLKHGRAYRILPHYICDACDNTKTIERLKKGMA